MLMRLSIFAEIAHDLFCRISPDRLALPPGESFRGSMSEVSISLLQPSHVHAVKIYSSSTRNMILLVISFEFDARRSGDD